MAEFETNGRAQRFETRDNLTRIRMLLVRCMSPLLALSGHRSLQCTCPLSGVKQTLRFAAHMSAFDPKQLIATFA
jgi:hypothetical protein